METTIAPATSHLNARARHLLLGAAVLVSVGLVSLAFAFSRPPPPAAAPAPGMTIGDDKIGLEPEAPPWRMLRLGTASQAAAHWSESVPARVRIDERLASRVGAPLGGRVTNVFVELGQSVKAGQPLFSISSREIASLRAERDKAAVDRAVAVKNLERVRSMVTAESLPAKEALLAEQAAQQAELELRSAEARLGSLRISSRSDAEFSVLASRDGVVVEKNVLPSQEVGSDNGTPLVVIADLTNVWVVAELFEADTAGIAEGTRARMSFPSLPGKTFEGPVTMLARVVDPERHTVGVRIDLPNPGGVIKPNVYAQVSFAVAPEPGTAEVPSTAVLSDGAHDYVYVQETVGQFARREVVTGPTREGRVLVSKGLAAGETLVEDGAVLLENALALAH
jgi:RND family efflux transporter MFP subunit